MSNSTANTNVIAKIAAVVAGLGLIAMTFAPAVKADTTSDQAMIASLQAQLAALQSKMTSSSTTTGSSMVSTAFNFNLKVGSKGASVMALQNFLISKGFTLAAGPTGYFGSQTKAALGAYQASVGISPAVGFFGPITRAKVNGSMTTTTTTTTTTTGTTAGCVAGAMFSSTTGQSCGTTTTSGGLTGNEGSIDNFKTVGALTTSLNQADSQQVLGFEFKAGGSDLRIGRVDFDIVNSITTGTIRPWGVFQTATLKNGTNTIGTIDLTNAANYSQDSVLANGNQQYRVRFDNLTDVVRLGAVADYYLTLSTQNSLSTTNAGGNYTITLPTLGVRATDAKGFDQFSSPTVVATASVSSMSSGSVVLSLGSDNPQTTTVQGDYSVSTPGITLNTFTIQSKNADVMLYSLPVNVTATGTPASTMIRTLKLYQGSTLLDTESIAASSTIGTATTTFQNLNFKIPSGSTLPFKVVAEINRIDGSTGGPFVEGSGVTVTVPTGNALDIENGTNRLSIAGGATGNQISFRSLGLSADGSPSVYSATAAFNSSGGGSTTQTGTFNFTFNVTAFGQDVFVSSTSAAFTATLSSGNAASSTVTASAISSTADRDSSTQNFVIHSGQTKSVTVTLTRNGGNNTNYTARLNTLLFGTSASTPTTSTINLPSAYTTGNVIINS
jgi:hypothetical protein